MSLTAADVAEIMRLVEQSAFNELDLEIDGVKLSFRRGEGASRVVSAPEQKPPPKPQAVPQPPVVADPNVHEVPSPLLGTFYRAPKPGAPPFVEVGAKVEEDTVVAIIEVMKLMNTVRAGVRGTVTEILVADGALAEYSQPLLRVRKAG